jgi:hypothetical protein
MLSYVFLYCVERLPNGIRIGPEIYFPAGFFASEHTGLAQYPQVVRHRGPRQCGRRNNLANIEAFPRLEHQHDSLPMRIAQRHKNPGDAPPCLWNCLPVSLYHSYMTSYIVALLYALPSRCQAVADASR